MSYNFKSKKMRKYNVTQEKLNRTLSFLTEVYEKTNCNYSKLNQDDIISKYRLNKKSFLVLRKIGWLNVRGIRRTSEYFWKVKKPDIRMAVLFIKNSSKTDNLNFINETEIKPMRPVRTIKNKTSFENRSIRKTKVQNIEKVKQKEFSLLWGLIKINY